jgi:hypothetical protein
VHDRFKRSRASFVAEHDRAERLAIERSRRVEDPGPNARASSSTIGMPFAWSSCTIASASMIVAPSSRSMRDRALARADPAGEANHDAHARM